MCVVGGDDAARPETNRRPYRQNPQGFSGDGIRLTRVETLPGRIAFLAGALSFGNGGARARPQVECGEGAVRHSTAAGVGTGWTQRSTLSGRKALAIVRATEHDQDVPPGTFR